MNDLISILVPIYNVQAYLDKCIHSLVNQTYTNIEILLINDGSTDDSEKICLAYAKKDSRIKYLKKENGGLADARNFGLAVAKGKYIAFVDADDYVKSEMIERMYLNLLEHKADLSEIDFCLEDELGKKKKKRKPRFCVFSREEAIEAFLSGSGIENIVWNKLYAYALIKDIRFPINNRSLGEDIFFNLEALAKARRVVVDTREYYYHYVVRLNSLVNQKFSMKHIGLIKKMEEDTFTIKTEFKEAFEAKLIREKVKCLNKMYAAKNLDAVFLPWLEKYQKDVQAYPFFKARKYLSKKHLLTLYLMKLSPRLYTLLYRKFQKQ